MHALDATKLSFDTDKYLDTALRLLREAQEAMRPADSRDLPRLFDRLCNKVGTNKDVLTRTEIDKALGNPAIKGEEAQALVALKQHFAKLSGLKDDGKDTGDRISKADVAAAAAGDKDIDSSMADTRKTVRQSKRTLFADDSKPLESISHDAVVQAGLGNCYFYAALASLADCNPKAVRDMIAQNKDGTYTVTFPGSKSIRVNGPTDAELVLFPKPTDKGVWVHVLEKAYGEYCMNNSMYKMLRQIRGYEDSVIPQEHTDGGSALDAGLKILTNKGVTWSWCFKGPQVTHAALVDAFKNNVPVTADTGLQVRLPGGPATQHVYSVLKYDQKNKILTLRNPWADGVPTVAGVKDLGKGVFEIPLGVFGAYFTKISYPK